MKTWRIILCALTGPAFLPLPSNAVNAQPATATILDEVAVIERPGCLLLDVKFTLPVRYEWHFPASFGKELRIRIAPIVTNPADQSALAIRESTVPRMTRGAELLGVDVEQVDYEGDIAGGPFVTLFFKEAVAYKVAQGKDYRSIVIASPGPEASKNCKPELPAN